MRALNREADILKYRALILKDTIRDDARELARAREPKRAFA
ncbi:hypothetical protein [Smaragdicoccus niigatensis]|nr:hypothetical protein [Smaragdicoccus niigatensis]